MAKETMIIKNNIPVEEYEEFVKGYLEQLSSENDIAIFPRRWGRYYYMHKGLVHEIRLEENQVIEDTFESWSVEERNFVMGL